MKATTPWLGSAIVAALAVSSAAAQCPGGHAVRLAPDACGPGYYAPNEYGLWFGPNHDLYPPCRPFNGMVFGPGGPDGKDGKEAPGGPGGPYGPGAAGGPYGPAAAGGPYGPGTPGGPAGPHGPTALTVRLRPRAAYPRVPGAPGPYLGPKGSESLQGAVRVAG